ncbi:membrane protein [Paenibacillus sp. 598K]|uniref:ABC transporter permease n=1 Tax=Paenibacillus sp. 598K TaxID=1117987 RepID=UPI000FF9BE9F|nr:ABC transporter permease subunit [Paenibacillus sp. 598K]GBF72574.1 membrane protein [Paenibacillus sp. 598K]
MTGFGPMLKKELSELYYSMRIVYVPIVFTLLALMQPVTMSLLPKLLESTDLPPGTVISVTEPQAIDVMGTLLQQFGTLGTMVVILITMGAIAGERASGVAPMVLSKPLSRAAYFTAKGAAYAVLVTISLVVAMLISTYYTERLFGAVDWGAALLGTLAYIPVLWLLVSITLCTSALFRSQIAAGGVAFVVYLLLSVVPSFLGGFVRWLSPNKLAEASSALLIGTEADRIGLPIAGALALGAFFYLMGILALQTREL